MCLEQSVGVWLGVCPSCRAEADRAERYARQTRANAEQLLITAASLARQALVLRLAIHRLEATAMRLPFHLPDEARILAENPTHVRGHGHAA